MPVLNQTDVTGPQHEVQRLLGRCLLRLQQCELLLRSMTAMQKFSGTPETLQRGLDASKASVCGKTLGTLIGRLMGDYIMKESCEVSDVAPDHGTDSFYISFQAQLKVSDEGYDALQADLRELVTVRNSLVHHFIELHDLWTVDGCLVAQDALRRTYAEIDRHVEQLRTFAGYMDDARRGAAELLQSPQFFDVIVNGITPDGQIHWPAAGIVGALRQALQELSIDGWVNLDAAARWVSENHPEQTPQKYGCSRWRHVVHECGQFEIRRFRHNGQFGAWFRARAIAAA